MMFWAIRFVLFWIIWLVFANKKRWREILPVCFFTAFLGSTSDNLTHHFHLWEYDKSELNLVADLTNNWSVYVVTLYLLIQWLPKRQTFWPISRYLFLWTGFAFIVEWIHISTGHMNYPTWWNIWWSYLADWILFGLIYQYYKIFQFERLSQTSEIYLQSFYCNPCAMIITEIETGLILKVNKSFEDLTGYSSDEIIGQTSKDIHIFADYDEENKRIALMKKNGFLRNYDGKIIRKDKSTWVGLFDGEFINADGKKILLTVLNDVRFHS